MTSLPLFRATTLSLLTCYDTLEFHRRRLRVFRRVVHLDKTDVRKGPENSTQETTKYWHPRPIVSRAVKKEEYIIKVTLLQTLAEPVGN